jgi:hypothetical protein
MQPIYNPENDTFEYIKDGKKTAITMEEMEHYDKMASEHREKLEMELPSTVFELAQTYPEAREYLENKVAEQDEEIVKLNELEKYVNTAKIYRKPEHRRTKYIRLTMIEMDKQKLIQQVEFNESIIDAIKSKGRKRTPKGALSESDIQNAKAVPITNYIEFRRDSKAKCIWHSERSGSMHYYPKTNTVHCFGGGQSGDVVDVIQQLNGVEFRDAVRFLINK